MGPPDQREMKYIHSLFTDGLKTYQLNHQNLKMAYEILVQASMDNRALYSVKKCAEIVFKNDRIKKMRIAKTAGNNENLHSNENEIYKFLECELVEKKIVMKKEMEI